MDLDNYSKIDGKVIKTEEISTDKLLALKKDSEDNIEQLTRKLHSDTADINEKIEYFQSVITKINNLLK